MSTQRTLIAEEDCQNGRSPFVASRGYACGDAVIWLHAPRGGYGYIIPVPARVVAAGSSRVRIAAKLANGREKIINVKASNLRKAASTHT